MIENYLNKEAQIIIAFADYSPTKDGASPLCIFGKVTNVDEDYVCVEYDPNRQKDKYSFHNTTGKMIVRKGYIISIILL